MRVAVEDSGVVVCAAPTGRITQNTSMPTRNGTLPSSGHRARRRPRLLTERDRFRIGRAAAAERRPQTESGGRGSYARLLLDRPRLEPVGRGAVDGACSAGSVCAAHWPQQRPVDFLRHATLPGAVPTHARVTQTPSSSMRQEPSGAGELARATGRTDDRARHDLYAATYPGRRGPGRRTPREVRQFD